MFHKHQKLQQDSKKENNSPKNSRKTIFYIQSELFIQERSVQTWNNVKKIQYKSCRRRDNVYSSLIQSLFCSQTNLQFSRFELYSSPCINVHRRYRAKINNLYAKDTSNVYNERDSRFNSNSALWKVLPTSLPCILPLADA